MKKKKKSFLPFLDVPGSLHSFPLFALVVPNGQTLGTQQSLVFPLQYSLIWGHSEGWSSSGMTEVWLSWLVQSSGTQSWIKGFREFPTQLWQEMQPNICRHVGANCKMHPRLRLSLSKEVGRAAHHRFSEFLGGRPGAVWSCVFPCTGRKEPWWHWDHWSAPDPAHALAHGLQPGRDHSLWEEHTARSAHSHSLSPSQTPPAHKARSKYFALLLKSRPQCQGHFLEMVLAPKVCTAFSHCHRMGQRLPAPEQVKQTVSGVKGYWL